MRGIFQGISLCLHNTLQVRFVVVVHRHSGLHFRYLRYSFTEAHNTLFFFTIQTMAPHTTDEAHHLLPTKADTLSTTIQPSVSAATPYLILLLSAFFNALMTIVIDVAETKYNLPFTSSLFINTIVTIFLSVVVIIQGRQFHLFQLPQAQIARLAAAGLLGGISAALMYSSLTHVSAGTATTLFYSCPAMTAVLCTIAFGEPFTLRLVIVLFLNAAGISLVSHPAMVPGDSNNAIWGVVQALVAAFAAALSFTFVKWMGTTVHFSHNMLAFGVGCAVMSMVMISRENVTQIFNNTTGSLLAVASASFAFVSKSALNYALPLCAGGTGLVVRSLSVPITFILGLMFVGELPTLSGIAGAFLVLMSVAGLATENNESS